MSQLDTSKPFGQVFGSVAGIRYEQAGKFFDGQKREIDANGVLKPTKAKAPAQDNSGKAPETSSEQSQDNGDGQESQGADAIDPANEDQNKQPVAPAKPAAAKKAAPKKATTKKSEPAGVKSMRDQVKDEAK